MDQVDFLLEINIRVSYELVLLLLMDVTRHAQSTQNNKFAISLQYFKEEVKDKCVFLHEDKYQNCPYPGLPKIPKIANLSYLCNISRKKGGMKLIFCMQVNIRLSYKLIPLILVSMARPVQSTQNKKFGKSL